MGNRWLTPVLLLVSVHLLLCACAGGAGCPRKDFVEAGTSIQEWPLLSRTSTLATVNRTSEAGYCHTRQKLLWKVKGIDAIQIGFDHIDFKKSVLFYGIRIKGTFKPRIFDQMPTPSEDEPHELVFDSRVDGSTLQWQRLVAFKADTIPSESAVWAVEIFVPAKVRRNYRVIVDHLSLSEMKLTVEIHSDGLHAGTLSETYSVPPADLQYLGLVSFIGPGLNASDLFMWPSCGNPDYPVTALPTRQDQ